MNSNTTRRPRVFVVQEVMKRTEQGQLRRAFDVTPAAVYGDLNFLLGSDASPLNPAPVVFEMKSKLRDFSDDDVLLAVGDPINIGIAAAVAARANNGRVAMLKWDRETRSYIRIGFQL